MRPQRRETAHRPGTGTLPPMERQPRRPPHLGTAPAHRINPAQITPAPAWPPRTATSALGMPSPRTSEYLRLIYAIVWIIVLQVVLTAIYVDETASTILTLVTTMTGLSGHSAASKARTAALEAFDQAYPPKN